MRPALALDADEKRLLIVDALAEPIGTFGEKAVRGAFEKEKRGTRLQLGIHLEQLRVSRFERAEMFFLFFRKFLKDRAPAKILGDTRGAGVELEAAALGRDRDAQRVARENHLGGAALRSGRLAGLTFLARAVDLHHALLAGEFSRRGHLFDERF